MIALFSHLLCVIVVIAVSACGGSAAESGTITQKSAPSPLDTNTFLSIANDTTCAELQNRLFVIDQQYVLSEKLGNCADARYRQTLYGKTPSTVLCTNTDSIAGARLSCSDANLTSLFKQAIANLDLADLGLGPNHQVQQISVPSTTQTSVIIDSLAPRLFYGQAPSNIIIKDAKAWDSFSGYGEFAVPMSSNIDFSNRMVIGVFSKTANNCNQPSIHRVSSSGQRLTVQFSERSIIPIATCDVANNARSTPMSLVSSPRLALPIDFVDVTPALIDAALITQSNLSGIRSPRTVVIKDQTSWEKLWSEHDNGNQALPVVDFSKKNVIAIFAGSKPNGCYGISEVRMYRENGRIIVAINETSPSPVALCALYIPSPAYIATIDKTNEPVEFTTISAKN